ncbi:GNAT family N-acetyltransferase [Pseudonocardia sp. CA-142604]|uniref:GNAT family N-acetyltransferase n=1 Tax=Pseudonocardia sp. CA-142604 TaxID=3240024 RepID=UPI003D926CA3
MQLDDLGAVVELLLETSVLGIRPRLVDRLTAGDAEKADIAIVVERDGVVIGAAELAAEPAFPGTVSGLVAVAEAERGRGIGAELAGMLLEHLEQQSDAESAMCAIRDDLPGGREFAERFGFVVTNHSSVWRHDLSDQLSELLDRTAYAVDLAQVQIRFVEPVAERTAVTEFIRTCMAGLAVPSENVHGFDPGEASHLIPDSARVVLAEAREGFNRACGVTILAPGTNIDAWHIAFIGVDPGCRRRGVAEALLSASLLDAWQMGVREVTLVNDDSNEAMVRLCHRLGMKRTAGYWSLARRRDL